MTRRPHIGKRRHKEVAWLVMGYLTRWRVEEAIRFMKQSDTLEDIRVLTYRRLRNMVVLVNAEAFFTAVELGTRINLDILATHLEKASKRIFGVPDFRLYALADGIREICAHEPVDLWIIQSQAVWRRPGGWWCQDFPTTMERPVSELVMGLKLS